jgi:porin
MKAGWLAAAAILLLPAIPAAAQEANTSETISAAETDNAPEKPASLSAALGLPGVSPRLDVTAFTQAMVSGDGNKDARFTGRADLFVDFSSKGLGLWEGTLLRTHTELRANNRGAGSFGGALWPSNVGAVLPLTGEGIELTSFYIVQSLGPKTNLIAGKVNAVDLLASDPFFGGWATKRFQNIAFVAPPSGVVPPTIMGTILTHQVGSVGLTAMVFDPEDRSGDYWVDALFSTGVNLSFGGTWQGTMGGRKTSIGLTLAGSTSRGQDFEDILAPPDLATSTKKGSYNIALQLGHSLTMRDKGPGSLGLYAKVAIADGNPNLIQSSIVGGLAGQGLFAGRPNDRFGLGGYFYNFSDVLQDVTAPLLEFDDELGFEAWYSFPILPNADLAFNAQLIDPASGQRSNALLLGARLNLHF